MKKQWAESKAIAFENQAGICLICENPLKLTNCTGHHLVNRCQGGKDTADNCECRHTQCERFMHANYPFGNYKGNLGGNNVGRSAVRRRRNCGNRGQRTPAIQNSRTEAIEPSLGSDIRNVIILQCDVANTSHLDFTRLGANRIQFSINADNSIRITIHLEV